jgi:hypothetical protein
MKNYKSIFFITLSLLLTSILQATKVEFARTDGNYTAQIFKDGNSRSEIAYATQTVNRSTILDIPVLEQGGVTMRISKTPIDVLLVYVYCMKLKNGTLSDNATINDDSQHLVSGNKMVGFLGNGNTLTINNTFVFSFRPVGGFKSVYLMANKVKYINKR